MKLEYVVCTVVKNVITFSQAFPIFNGENSSQNDFISFLGHGSIGISEYCGSLKIYANACIYIYLRDADDLAPEQGSGAISPHIADDVLTLYK